MVAKPGVIRQRDVTRIIQGAADAGVKMGIVVKGSEVHFLPVDQMVAEPEPKSALERWMSNRNASEVAGNS